MINRLKALVTLFVFLFAFRAYAANPVICFTDLTSGPDTGIGDGNGSGAIATAWGWHLGSSQGASNVYYKAADGSSDAAAYVYYWGNADGVSGGGPADLYTYHNMQEISFSMPDIADSLPDSGSIYVTVGGVNSNELPFVMRTGNIYHCKTTGNNSTGDGSWANPWLNTNFYTDGALGQTIIAGDTVYVGDGVDDIWANYGMAFVTQLTGATNNHIAFIAYPGADWDVQGPDKGVANGNNVSSYIVVSKADVRGEWVSVWQDSR
jgi:hypothetical protein